MVYDIIFNWVGIHPPTNTPKTVPNWALLAQVDLFIISRPLKGDMLPKSKSTGG